MKPKVWGGTQLGVCGQERVIVCASSKREAAKMVGCSLYEFNGYWAETGNAVELSVATERGVWAAELDKPNKKAKDYQYKEGSAEK